MNKVSDHVQSQHSKMPDFGAFLEAHPNCNKYQNSETAREVYEFLSTPRSVMDMVRANKEGRPALYGALHELESRWGEHQDFSFNERFVRQTVGLMVRFILEPFGYQSLIQRNMPRGNFRYFTSGMCYAHQESQQRLEVIARYDIVERKHPN